MIVRPREGRPPLGEEEPIAVRERGGRGTGGCRRRIRQGFGRCRMEPGRAVCCLREDGLNGGMLPVGCMRSRFFEKNTG